MQVRNRNWRRAQRALSIARARIRASRIGVSSEIWVRRSAVTPHPCSGWCCGNPRRWFGEEVMAQRRAPHIEDDWG